MWYPYLSVFIVSSLLLYVSTYDESCPGTFCETLSEVLNYAAEYSAPKMKYPRKQTSNSNTSRAMNDNKDILSIWMTMDALRVVGPLWDARKQSKHCLKRTLRQANAFTPNHLYSEGMLTSSANVRKAFDVVCNDSLSRKLFHMVDHHRWNFIYQNLKSSVQVKLDGLLGNSFDIQYRSH